MRRTDFVTSASRLEDATRRLEQKWLETRELWSDPVSQRVEDEFLVPLHGQVRTMLDAINHLSRTVANSERSCAHPRELNEYF